MDWLAQFTPKIPEANTESFKRAFLGRMLFSGDDVFKPIHTLSGGEKGRVALTALMLRKDNLLLLDEPTSNLDSLNETVILKAQKSDRICSHKEELFRLLSESVIISTFG